MNTCIKLLAAFVVASLAALSPGCSNQSEGQPCNRNAGNGGDDDCSSGLSCQQIGTLQLCCPVPPATPTVSECQQGANLPDGGGLDVVEAAVTSDAGTETGQDAAEEQASSDDASAE
jgi:hypothetical protein